MERVSRQRDFGLDLVRATAGVLTLSVHFFLNNSFYEAPVAGKTMLIACMVRMLCMSCVPLFLLLTGYTCIDRKWSKGYYRKLLPVLLSYVVAGAACMVFRGAVRGNGFTLREVVMEFVRYNASPYAWYIEMYIGLFLLSPFLNAAWRSLEDGGKRALVLTLVGLTALPGAINQLWLPLLPEWWMGIYPLTYYALGAWLREHPLRFKGWQFLLCGAGLAVLIGVKGYFNANGGVYLRMPEDEWGSFVLTLQSACLFSGLKQVKGDRMPAPVCWCVSRVAKLALLMYLVSFISDWVVYHMLALAVPVVQCRLHWMPLAVPIAVVCSLALAQLAEWAVAALIKIVPARIKIAQES